MCQDSLCKNSEGLTLIEIMVSILFLSLIALSLAHTLTNSLYLSAQDSNIVNATNLSRYYLNEVTQEWQKRLSDATASGFDNPSLPSLGTYTDEGEYNLTDSYYTQNGKYTVHVYTNDLASTYDEDTSSTIVTLRRVRIVYYDNLENKLIDLYLDYSRPGSYVVPQY